MGSSQGAIQVSDYNYDCGEEYNQQNKGSCYLLKVLEVDYVSMATEHSTQVSLSLCWTTKKHGTFID